MVMEKKINSWKYIHTAMDKIEEKTGKSWIRCFQCKALENVKPQLKSKIKKEGGSTYQVPAEVK